MNSAIDRVAIGALSERASRASDGMEGLGPFGDDGAARYDLEYEHMSRRYRSAHAMQNRIARSALSREATTTNVIVDIGCGTANDGIQILRPLQNATYFGIDRAAPMLVRAQSKICAEGLANRSLFMMADFRDLSAAAVRSALLNHGIAPNVCCLICTLTLHHYNIDDRRMIYQVASSLLTHQGILVVTDLYTDAFPFCAQEALAQEIQDIRLAAEHVDRKIGASDAPTTLSEKHYLFDNKPAELTEELDLIRTAGFSKVDVPFRSGQLAIIVGHMRHRS